MSLSFVEPPTRKTLSDARESLETTRVSVQDVTRKIDDAESALAQIIRESRCVIKEMEAQRAALEKEMNRTLAYLSPIRRLPTELLREIFMCNLEEFPCCAWVLAAVCTSWRQLALRMPKLWSKIRLLTTQHASADTIRLWLERSGSTVPLDIEIFLRVGDSSPSSDGSSRRRRHVSALSSPTSPTVPSWALPFSSSNGSSAQYVIPHNPHATHGITVVPSTPPIVIPSSPPPGQDPWAAASSSQSSSEQPHSTKTRSMHWGHIAFFYLVEQMHRWERFVFRFDKQFNSMNALKSITGDAPLLKEFEVSSIEPAFYAEWPWLPNASPSTTIILPELKTLTLQYAPFQWSSPMLRANLHTLNLHALPTYHLSLDRILNIISSNPSLKNLSLHFNGVQPAILPLTPTTLHELESFTIGGHHILTQLVDSLNIPNLKSLTLDIEARDPVEDIISNLFTRSGNPAITHLSVGYGSATNTSTFYYPGGIVISWPALLADLTHLKTAQIGGTPLDPLLIALGPPDDDTNQLTNWACPSLESLSMRNCHAHSEGISRLVQMVDARNPDAQGSSSNAGSVNGVTPVRLKLLEMYDCTSLGQDVLKWLNGRIEDVVCTEPTHESRSPMSHSYSFMG